MSEAITCCHGTFMFAVELYAQKQLEDVEGQETEGFALGAGRGQAGPLLPTPRTAEAKSSRGGGGCQPCWSLQIQLPLSYH